jgi:hypothetical protein
VNLDPPSPRILASHENDGRDPTMARDRKTKNTRRDEGKASSRFLWIRAGATMLTRSEEEDSERRTPQTAVDKARTHQRSCCLPLLLLVLSPSPGNPAWQSQRDQASKIGTTSSSLFAVGCFSTFASTKTRFWFQAQFE